MGVQVSGSQGGASLDIEHSRMEELAGKGIVSPRTQKVGTEWEMGPGKGVELSVKSWKTNTPGAPSSSTAQRLVWSDEAGTSASQKRLPPQ